MSITVAAPEASAPVSRPVVAARLTFLGVLRGEWTKLLSLRSTWWVLAATVVLITGISLAVAFSLEAVAADLASAPGAAAPASGAEVVSGGFQMGMLTIAVLGALLITGEYSTGMIRSTLAAVPTRVPVLAAKAVVLTAVTVAVATVSIALAYVVTMPLLADLDLVPALDDGRGQHPPRRAQREQLGPLPAQDAEEGQARCHDGPADRRRRLRSRDGDAHRFMPFVSL